tara:strand:- start:945 stop:1160 length:216 start_codon:yes stop_codon:yes gene_type:complete
MNKSPGALLRRVTPTSYNIDFARNFLGNIQALVTAQSNPYYRIFHFYLALAAERSSLPVAELMQNRRNIAA